MVYGNWKGVKIVYLFYGTERSVDTKTAFCSCIILDTLKKGVLYS